MKMAHTTSSRSAAAVGLLLVLVHLVRLLGGDHDPYIDLLMLVPIVVTSAATLKVHRDNCVESRVVLGLIAAASAGSVALAATAGLPGRDVHPFGPLGALTLALSIAVIGLLLADQPRRVTRRRTRSPYAS
ncbi:hypothetical protein [Aeromicrobium chenweiae]|uniref:Uncharacterized protein n=1 Tax=Aeromicrobium chenweiae TaxID=2079793 RepID=A0A2S0WIK5_9ACTN|nr:hypothetical protein [Aeromicrobium chenweiae]AWB91168.1 hypothetical protein C3E78_02425 [Aeromicrobium chenweiae]TGN31687.1 hypothetical protein E4L97_11935 [Aeromicrobium chenweiae]